MNAKYLLLPEFSFELPPQSVQIITFCFDSFLDSWGDFCSILNAEEMQRATNFVFPEHRIRFIIAHGILRLVLSEYTHCPPHELQFSTTSRGKPYFTDLALANWHFNLSHADTGFAIAITRMAPVGIDIELLKSARDLLQMAARFFAASEAESLAALDKSEQLTGFYRLWTYKEAVLKATGDGIANGLEQWIFDISHMPVTLKNAPGTTDCQQWRFYHKPLPQLQALMTVAIDSPEVNFMLHQAEQLQST